MEAVPRGRPPTHTNIRAAVVAHIVAPIARNSSSHCSKAKPNDEQRRNKRKWSILYWLASRLTIPLVALLIPLHCHIAQVGGEGIKRVVDLQLL